MEYDKSKLPNESFEGFAIRTGYKLKGGQGVDGSKYSVNIYGTVSKLNKDDARNLGTSGKQFKC